MIAQDSRERPVHGLGHGDHVCLAFADDSEQRRVVTAYMSDGLKRGERVMYFTDRHKPAVVLDWLRSAHVDPDAALSSGQLQVVTACDGYLVSGRFDATAMVATLRQEMASAAACGYKGFRVSGEMSWALREIPGADEVAAYESMVNSLFEGQPASAVCQYDARLFPPAQLQTYDHCHPGTVQLSPLYEDKLLRIVPAFEEGERTMRVIGTVDYRTTDALTAVLDATLDWAGDVRVDMSKLEFIDLAGLRALSHTAERYEPGRRMRVVELAPLLCQVISVAGFDQQDALVVTSPGVSA
ncbi:MEDS domain-containing protein [Streptomyces sp. ISL-66]|uniref:MEDS domain-containing protein n=1 Tax=Streptomyces sp. ISL-66 TaxID=2819186 RepID=UPI001BEBAC9F|nr:MEDS domain-containing protein [Streptomyces sp. ISL-66]MBT2468992.1 MEDS domain-containing protein [Streptomyces sp. ISL-66]